MDVLLIEDKAEMSALLQAVLKSRGHTVTATADGKSGLENYRSRQFHIVILDWLLPDMDGLKVCRQIRSSENGADSLILAITERTKPGDLKRILAAGADDFLADPIDKSLLETRLAIAELRATSMMHQRETEASCAQAKSMLQLVLDTIPARVFWKDTQSRYLGCNHLFAMDAGLQDPSQIVGKTDHDLCWAELAQHCISDDRTVIQSGRPKINFEERQTTPCGGLMVMESSKIPLKDVNGNLIGVLGTYQDLTERKRAEDAMIAAQGKLAGMLDALPDLLFELDLDGHYFDYHSSRPDLLAVPVEDLIGKTVHDILPAKAADVVMSALREANETGRSQGGQFELRVPLGTLWFELSVACKPVAAGMAPRFIVLSRDISKRKQAENALLKNETLLKESQRMAKIGSWELDLMNDTLSWSDECFRIFEIEPTQFSASYGAFLDMIHPDDRAAVDKAYKASLKNRTPYIIIHRLLFRGQRVKYVQEWGETQYDDEGRPVRSVGTAQDITERMHAEAEIRALNLNLEEQVRERTKELLAKEGQLREALALNDNILMSSAVGIAAYRQDGQCVAANPSLASIAGGTQELLLKQNFRQLGSWQASGLLEAAERALATGARVEHEVRYCTSFNRDIWARGQLSRFTSRGEPHLLLMLENITEKKAAEEELRLAASVFKNSSEGILVTDADGIVLSANPAFTKITGYTEDEARGQNARLLRSERHGPGFYRSMWDALAKEGYWQGDIWNRKKNGEDYLAWLAINRIEGSAGDPIRYVSVFHDITEVRRKDEQIRHQAFHDALTGLPNRALMQDRLRHALERAQRESGRLSVTFVDLDHFKAINDVLGHDIGDLLLQEVAHRIKSRMRNVDTVARLGGDEFVVLMEDLHKAGDCACLAQELIADITRPMVLNGHAVEISASMGLAFFPEDGTNPQELMKRADLAMYAAKSAGRNTFRFFRQDMQDQISLRLNQEMELRNALAQQELELHYQPKVDIATGNIRCVEALVRWRHPLRGLLLPADFIPLAEECGLIGELGDWVINEICRQSAAWQIAGHTLKIAFNISSHQLEYGDLVTRISELATHHGVALTNLEIELTESAVLTYSKYAISVLACLRGIGITIAVSDFCAGYSSLAYLRQLPIDVLKINHSFVMDADRNEEDAEIVKTILALGRMFKLTIEAEGIETSHQAELLQSFGCGIAQGYFFSRPLPVQEFESWLNAEIHTSSSRIALK